MTDLILHWAISNGCHIGWKLAQLVSAPLPTLPPNATKEITTDLIKNYALENNFELTKVRSSETRIYFQCKRRGVYRNTRELAEANRKRQKDSCKCNCSYYIKVKTTKDGGFFYTQPTGDEHFHSHPLSAENVFLSSNGRKNKLHSDDVKKIQKGIEQEVPTKLIQKLISAESGVNKLTVHDINNLRYKNTDRVNLRSDNGAKLLIHHIESNNATLKYFNNSNICSELKNKVFAMMTCSTSERYNVLKQHVDEILSNTNNFTNAEMLQKFNTYYTNEWVKYTERWAGHITSKLKHFGCVTTQRADSGHSIVKKGMFFLQPLDLAFSTIDSNLSNFERGYKDIENGEKYKVDVRVSLEPRLAHLIGKVTHRAFVFLRTEILRKSVDISSPCSYQCGLNYGLPCFHDLQRLEKIKMENIPSRWWFERLQSSIRYEEFSVEAEILESVMNIMIEDETWVDELSLRLHSNDDVKSLGRPKKTVRLSAFKKGHAKKTASNLAIHKVELENDDDEEVWEVKGLNRKADEWVGMPERAKRRKVDLAEENENFSKLHSSIDKSNVKAVYDPAGDGYCGFRAIAFLHYGDENKFQLVKKDMLLALQKNKEYYANILGQNVVELKVTISRGLKDAAESAIWFKSSGCAQVVADAYNIPVCVYN
ncbi:uncharacterized protein EV154DRAFT_485100 [Mucor mucedo]|uniref:uncharacterized protein n=1 Tax=Mucor mucedo TaxID=29922 RepID=UPI00221EE470|nr:uncharacterized protein EV154DRAFT_485100 [Mucor mucedo]KAI7886552.1 hypothetical protein EV154DRAFT_485100 [Mucor mucedo]